MFLEERSQKVRPEVSLATGVQACPLSPPLEHKIKEGVWEAEIERES